MGRFLSVDKEVTQSGSLMPDEAFAQYCMPCSRVLSCVSWTGAFAVTVLVTEFRKAHVSISGGISYVLCIHWPCVCFGEIVLSVIDHLCVVAWAC